MALADDVLHQPDRRQVAQRKAKLDGEEKDSEKGEQTASRDFA